MMDSYLPSVLYSEWLVVIMDVDKVTKEVEWAHEEVDKMVEEMTKVKKIAKKIVFYALNWREEWAEGLVWTCTLPRWPTRRLSSWRRWSRSPC